MNKPVGWRREHARHVAAGKGIRTQAELERRLFTLSGHAAEVKKERDRLGSYIEEETGYENEEEQEVLEANWEELDKELERTRDELVEVEETLIAIPGCEHCIRKGAAHKLAGDLRVDVYPPRNPVEDLIGGKVVIRKKK